MKKYILIVLLLLATTSVYATVTPGNIPRVRTGGLIPQIQDSVMLQYNNNIGIGSATPGTKVDVTGTVRATSFTGDGSGITGIPGASNYWSLNAVGINTTKNVGIGSSSPIQKLDVSGDIHLTGNVRADGDPYARKNWYLKIPTPSDLRSSVNASQDDEVWSMVEFQNNLYVGYFTAIATEQAKVYKWDGETMTLFHTFGTGVHFEITEVAAYKGKLYVGITGQSAGDADIYVYDPIADIWTKSFEDTIHNGVFKMGNYNGKLYAGFAYGSGMGDVYEFDGTTWTLSYDAPVGRNLIESMVEYNGKLYAGGGGGVAGTAYVVAYDGTTWTDVYTPTATARSIVNLVTYHGNLIAANQETDATAAEVIIYNSGTSWSDLKDDDSYTFCHGLAVYNDRLYSGCTTSGAIPAPIFVYDGSNGINGWSMVFTATGTEQEAFRLFPFNGELLAGYGFDSQEANIYAYRDQIGEQYTKTQKVLNSLTPDTSYDKSNLYSSFTKFTQGGNLVTLGNIGVNSTTPGTRLDVQGTTRTTAFQLNLSPLSGGNVLVSNSVGIGTWMSPSTLPTGAGGSGTVNTGLATFYGRYPSDGTTIDDSAITMDDGTNVGIGTITPLAKLNINTSANQDLFRVDDSAGTDATPFIIDSTGNVGIGTATPLAVLSISSTSNQTLVRVDDNGNGDLSPFIIDANGNVGIGTTNTERDLLLVMGGNVGIGTWVPSTALDVKGTIVTNGFQLSNNGAASGNVLVGNSVGLGTWMAASTLPISGGSGYATIQDETTPLTQRSTVNFTGSGVSCADNGGTSTTDCTINSGGGSSQWITQAGVGIGTTDKVGIGTTLMGNAGLTVMNGNVGIGTWNPNGGLIIMNGNVGIASIAPSDTLSIIGSIRASSNALIGGFVSTTSGASGSSNSIINNSLTTGTLLTISSTNSTGALTGIALDPQLTGVNNVGTVLRVSQLGVGGYTALFQDQASDPSPTAIDAAGNIGIGTVFANNSKLAIVGNVGIGTVKDGDLYITTTPPNGGMIIEGNVGIGTVNPGVILDINGTTRISNSGDSYFGGNIGIGTTIPMASLAVQGGAAIGTVTYTGTAVPSGNLVVSGNVGIGTQNPGTVLDVKGTGAKLRMQSPDGTLWNCQPVNTTGVFTCT